MRFASEIWHVASALAVALILSVLLVAAVSWTPEFDLIFIPLFYSSAFSFCLAVSLSVLLYTGRVGRSTSTRALFSVLLIILAAMVHLGFESVAANTVQWQNVLSARGTSSAIYLQSFVLYGKTILAFGVAAFGANLLAGTVPRVEA